MVNSAVVCWIRMFLAFALVMAMISGQGDAEFILSLSSVSLFLRESAFVYQQFRVVLPCEVLLVMFFYYSQYLHPRLWSSQVQLASWDAYRLCRRILRGLYVCVGLWLVCLRLGPPFQFPHHPSWRVAYHPVHPVPRLSCLCLASIRNFFSCWRCDGVRSCEIITLLNSVPLRFLMLSMNFTSSPQFLKLTNRGLFCQVLLSPDRCILRFFLRLRTPWLPSWSFLLFVAFRCISWVKYDDWGSSSTR